MVVISLLRPLVLAPLLAQAGRLRKRSRSGQTRKQKTETGHVANWTVRVLPIAAAAAHASVKASLASHNEVTSRVHWSQTMSIFGKIMGAIFGSKAAATPDPRAPGTIAGLRYPQHLAQDPHRVFSAAIFDEAESHVRVPAKIAIDFF